MAMIRHVCMRILNSDAVVVLLPELHCITFLVFYTLATQNTAFSYMFLLNL